MFNIWTDLFFLQNIRRYKYVQDPGFGFYMLWKFIEFNFNKITPQIIMLKEWEAGQRYFQFKVVPKVYLAITVDVLMFLETNNTIKYDTT